MAACSTMAKRSSAAAPRGATGNCRNPRRAQRGRRAAWFRPFCRLHRALDASVKLIDATLRAVEVSERCAHRRPVRTALKLNAVSDNLVLASARLGQAAKGLAKVNECIARSPGRAAGAPELLLEATDRFILVARWLHGTATQLFDLRDDLIHRVQSGELVPEPPPQPRRHNPLVPRPVPVRAFLRNRLPRVIQRISAVLKRRRRSRLPASLRVPRRTSQGRAPPLVPVCLL